MLKMVDGTGIIGLDMVCPLGVSTPQPPNYDKVELEGTGMLVLPNSLDAPLERLELGGKTEQVQTKGAQLFDASRYEGVTKNGVTVTVKDGVITATGTPNINAWIQVFVSKENYQKLFKPENKIYLKTNRSKDCNYDFGIYGAFGSPIIGTVREGNSGKVLPAELPRNDTDFYFFIDVKNGIELKGSIKPIVYHDGDGTWEPYTGNKPSPSPEYPQEIKNSGKWNEETQKYEVDVKITGKNLLNLQKEPDVKGIYQGWKCGNGELLTLSLKDKGNNADIKGCYIGFSKQGGEPNGIILVVDNGVIKTNPLTQKKAYVSIFPADETTIKKITERFDIQCEYGSNATEYEPFREPQTITLTSGRPITKWDKLVEQGGQIGWLYGGIVIDRFDGQSNKISIANKQGDVQNFSIQFDNVANGNGNTDIFVDKYRAVRLSYTKAEYGICCNWNDGVKYFSAPNENITTVDEFKAWLIDNPLKITYETTKTEFVPLPESEQNAIRALKTYYPTTVITADGGEVDPDIKVTYRKEI